MLITSWEQAAAWLVLLWVLFAVTTNKIKYEAAAFGGLLLLGLLGVSPTTALFAGFATPALFTVAIVLVMSAGIVESGILTGLGKTIARKVPSPLKQILAVSLATGLLSAFMNNVGAVGLMLPTSRRMAQRTGVAKGDFGLPLAYASILGGSATLIGTASNLIVSTFRMQAFGEPFRMFDFTAHGLVLLGSGLGIWFISQVSLSRRFAAGVSSHPAGVEKKEETLAETAPERSRRKTAIVLATLLPALLLASLGRVYPAVAFGMVVLIWIFTGLLSIEIAYQQLSFPILIFLGSMFSLSAILHDTGALQTVVSRWVPLLSLFSPLALIMSVLFLTAFFANILDNSVAAMLMSPLVIQFYQSGVVTVSADALLMAVAAGASLGIVLPTHQAVILSMETMDFQRKRFMKTGAMIALTAGVLAAAVIRALWS